MRRQGRIAGLTCPPFVAAFLFVSLAFAGSARAQDTHVLVIAGVAGDEEHAAQFDKWAATLVDAARKDAPPTADIGYLADKPERDSKRITGRSTRENVEKAFADLAARVRPNDEVVVILIGHGSFDGRQASFNLPGPDLTAADYARLLSKFPSQRVVFVNTSSSSGGFLQPLAAPGRTIITATKTAGERNDTRFPAFFAEAFSDPGADQNRDGRVSMSEAFEYAHNKVLQSYQKDGLLLTEHAALDDGNDGRLAATLFLQFDRSRTAIAEATDPALKALLEQQRALEDQIAALKLRQKTMDAAEYEQQMEKLLTDLAVKTRAIRALQDKKL